MSADFSQAVRVAQDLADRATTAAAQLKPGSWESVQALALASIAQSAAVLAARSTAD